MRYLTPALIVVLMISLIANTVMFLKWRSGRPILSVNGRHMSKNDLDIYLESIYGIDYKANFVRRTIVNDAAAKLHKAMTPVEVNEKFQEAKQMQWTYANTVNSSPWLADEARRTIQEQMELARVCANDVPVTADDIRDEYNLNPTKYDTPNKAETEVALLKNGPHTSEILQLISTGEIAGQNQAAKPGEQSSIIKPSAIMAAYRGEVRFIGDNNIFTFIQHFGTVEQSLVFGMRPGEVKQVPQKQIPPEILNAGYTTMVIRMLKVIPGHKSDLEDPKLGPNDPRQKDFLNTQETLKLSVALKHSNPPQEVLRNLYQNAKIEAEEQTDIDNIKRKLFPPEDTSQPVKPK